MNKKYLAAFLKDQKEVGVSPARIEYACFKAPEYKEVAAIFLDDSTSKENDEEDAKAIADAKSADTLLNLMRKGMSSQNREAMRNKLIEYDAELYPLMKEKVLSTRQDLFVENAVNYLLRCQENPCDWIVKEYNNVASDYMKSMLCLVLGVRGDEDVIPMLVEEVGRFQKEYPDEMFDQGPILAIQELAGFIKQNVQN